MALDRRSFIKTGSLSAAALLIGLPELKFLQFLESVENPLEYYPNRDWEKVYRDQYRYDSSFTFVCTPNDTHACRLRAYVRNGIVVRTEQAYDVDSYADLYGNKASVMWNPRGCQKGYTYPRRAYGPYRVKHPMVRKGWKEWVEAGFPDPTKAKNKQKYFRRGEDSWVKVSWEEGFGLVATGLLHIMEKYSGKKGAQRLRKQGYPEEMIEAMHGSGAQTVKIRGAMPLLGATRIFGFYRFANMLGLYDGKLGARGWSNFSWHGDLPPGHPMVTGVKCSDPELHDFRHSKLLVFLGKNMVESKMADAHWWIETIERGGKVVNISPEYSATSTKSDYWIPIRPGSDTALLLGVAQILIEEKLYDATFVKKHTDFPLLVRMDNLKVLRGSDIFPDYKNKTLTGYSVQVQKIKPELREKWGDFVIWNQTGNQPKVITRDDVGDEIMKRGIDPALEGTFKIKLTDGKEIEVKTVFQLYKEHLAEYDIDTVSQITGSPKDLILQLAKDLATIKPASIHTGEGVNHFFHCDLVTRAVWLPQVLTGNVGKPGANSGHWAGNYKGEVFDGLGVYLTEDPFHPNLDPQAKLEDIPRKKYYKGEEVCYWNYEERPLIVKGKNFTGKTHMPTPTKAEWIGNGNLLNNAKWAHNMIANVENRVEMIVYNELEWTASCEYADVVFPVHSWMELTLPDMTASCSNPFLQVWKGGIKPIFDTKQDNEILAGVAEKLSELTGDPRYRDYWKFVLEGKNEVYLQRILDASTTTKGYKVEELLKSDKGWLMNFRTYPRIPFWEQINESKPFYTKSGRMEFYREENEFIEYGENLIVHREPVEATPYLPNVIVGTHPAIKPNSYGIPLEAISADERQVRNIKMPWSQARNTKNPLWEKGFKFYCLTPKSRHTVHSSWSVVDWNLIWQSNFGDPYRMDNRTPGVGEHQMHMNPLDAQELGINDGDYAYVDANPDDRPYAGWKESDPFYRVSRLMVRVKYNPAYPRGVTMIKHGSFIATHKSVKAHETRADRRAVSEDTGYQSSFRYGSQQSITRGWLQPTMMTDSLVRKNYMGQEIGEGYEIDVHAPNTCPKETLVKVTKAEDGGMGGVGKWEPSRTGFTPAEENEDMKKYLEGSFLQKI